MMFFLQFQAFPQQQVISKNIYWVPTKEEAEALHVPFTPTLNSKISNEIEFKQSNELLVPGKPDFYIPNTDIILFQSP